MRRKESILLPVSRRAVACLIALPLADVRAVDRSAVPAHPFEVINPGRSVYPHDGCRLDSAAAPHSHP